MANIPARACPLAKKCGGCQLQNLSYDEQLHLKQATAIHLLGRFGHVEEIIGMKDPYHYRNKVQAAFGVNRQGQIISGVYQSASHRIVPVSDCMIEDTVADQIIVTIRGLLKSFKIRPYDEDTGRGTLRHVLVRRGRRSGEILVVLVTAHGMLPGKRNFVRALLQRHPDITTIVQNINAGQTSLVLGPHSEVLYGPGYIHEQLGDFTFRISPRAFYQINPVQTEVLYRTALDYAGLTGKETVVDAYCGTGTIGIFASRNAARVIGVENNRDAVRDAISNAKANRADNVRFYTADASDFLQDMAKAGEHADVIILDPPRAGSDERFLAAVTAVGPERVVYVSCNLIKFELRKILTKRFAVISVAAVLLLSLILSFSTLHSMYAFDGNGTEETGKAAVEIDKQIALKYEGKLTDNKVQQMMSEFKPTQDLHGMNAKYIYQNALQSSVFSHFADIDGSWNGLSVADVFGDKEIKVGYVNGWLSTSQNMAKIFIVLSLVIILLIAPVFSGEYGGVDNIILTSKYGKTKCATAKVLASLLSAVFITTLVVIFNLLIAVAIYGTEGLDCSILFAPIDFLEGYIPFNITCGTVLKYQILLAFMSAISVTGIVLILSAVCKSQMIAFVISAAIHVIPIMLPISETSALYRIIVLMPLFYSQYISIMSVEQMHNGMLYAVWSIPVAIALVVIGSIISHKAFSKHQVR